MLVTFFIALMICPVMARGTRGAFDQWGYNYTARIFNGPFGYADENRPGDGNIDTYLGRSTDSYGFYDDEGYYHHVLVDVKGAHLVMKWSEVWHMAVFGPDGIRYNGDELPWGPDAWCTNHVVGTGKIYDAVDLGDTDPEDYDFSEVSIIYEGKMTILSKIVWVGDTTGYTNPIWGQFAVIQKVICGQGEHLLFLENPAEFGTTP